MVFNLQSDCWRAPTCSYVWNKNALDRRMLRILFYWVGDGMGRWRGGGRISTLFSEKLRSYAFVGILEIDFFCNSRKGVPSGSKISLILILIIFKSWFGLLIGTIPLTEHFLIWFVDFRYLYSRQYLAQFKLRLKNV